MNRKYSKYPANRNPASYLDQHSGPRSHIHTKPC